MKRPYFSILIPTTGRPELMRMAIRSVLEQTYTDFEIVVADSSRSPLARRAATKSGDRRIRYIPVPPGRGPLAPWDAAAKEAGGEYVLWLDDDNYLLPYALALFRRAIDRSRADIVTANHFYYYDGHHPRRYLRNCLGVVPWTGEERSLDIGQALRSIYAFSRRGAGALVPRFHFSATVFRRHIIEAAIQRLGFVLLDDMPNIHSLQPILFAFAQSSYFVDQPVVIIGRLGVSMSQVWSTAARSRFARQPFRPTLSPLSGYTRLNAILENLLRVQRLLPDRLGEVRPDYERFAALYLQELWLLDTDAKTAIRNWRNLLSFLKTLPQAASEHLLGRARRLMVLAPLVWLSRRLRLHHLWRILYGRLLTRRQHIDPGQAMAGRSEFVIAIDDGYGVDSIATLAAHIRGIIREATGRDLYEEIKKSPSPTESSLS